MRLSAADKAKLAAVAALLVILPIVGIIVYMQWPASPEQPVVATSSTATPTAPASISQTSGMRQFFRLIQSDDTQKAAEMLAKDPSLAKEKRAADGATPLHLAQSVAMAKLLLDHGADISALDTRHSATPLRWIANRVVDRNAGALELVHFLQSKGAAEPDIYFATAIGDIAQMDKLLAADPSLLNKPAPKTDVAFDNCAPLQVAAYAGQVASAKFLLDHGADVHNRGNWANTEPLEKACWTGGADVVALLLDRGAKIDGTDKDFTHSPLYNAAMMGHVDVVKILLAHGAATSRRLIPDVRASMQHIDTEGPPEGTPEDFQQILAILSAIPTSQASMR